MTDSRADFFAVERDHTVDLSVDLGGLRLANPVMPASGCFGPELGDLVPVTELGALVTKTVFTEQRSGNAAHRLTESLAGMVNSVGIPSPGSRSFLDEVLPRYLVPGVPVIVSVGGLRVRTKGTASHTGGTPMHLRADAAAAAAEIVLLVESLAADPQHRGTRATVGRLDVRPGSITTIAGEADLYIDVRDLDSARQRTTAAEVVARAQSVCRRRNVACEVELLADASPVVLPHWLREIVAETCSSLDVAYRVLPSGASHDAQMVNYVVPSAMVFVPSRAGLSHTPAESTDPTQLATGVNVLVESMFRLDGVLSERTPK